MALANKPSLVEHGPLRFVIIDAPNDANLDAYIKELKGANVAALVRCCECGYSPERVKAAGITVQDLPFPDGDPPPEHVIAAWLTLCAATFGGGSGGKGSSGGAGGDGKAIAVHCVAGLGRAPVLVAIALIEEGMEPLDAIQLIRSRRRGAINAKQLAYLEHSYKRRRKGGKGCVVM